MGKGSVGFRIGADGKRNYHFYYDAPRAPGEPRQKVWKRGFRTAKEAYQELANEQARGKRVDAAQISVNAFLDRWLEYIHGEVEQTSYENYERLVRVHLKPAFGRKVLGELAALDVQSWLTQGRKKSVSSPRQIRASFRILKQALRMAVVWRLVAQNPCADLQPPRKKRSEALEDQERKQQRVLTEDELTRILEAATPWLRTAVIVAAGTGLRRGEVIGLQWGDIDFEKAELRVARAVEPSNNGLLIGPPKTVTSLRPIDLPEVVIEALRRHREHQAATRKRMRDDWQEEGWVFTRETGQVRNPKVLTNSWDYLAGKLGIQAVYHDLRHTHTSTLLAAGVAAQVVSRRLGHSSLRTLSVYSHAMPGEQKEAARVMDTTLRRSLGEQAPPAAEGS